MTVEPAIEIAVGSVVLCKVNGSQYLHLVSAVGQDGRYQISNNKGHVNGWCVCDNVFGVMTKVEVRCTNGFDETGQKVFKYSVTTATSANVTT